MIKMNKYSPFIQPYSKYSFNFDPNEANCVALLDANNYFQKKNYLIPYNGKNHLVTVEDTKFFPLDFYELLNLFINTIIETKILQNESVNIEYIYVILNILFTQNKFINQKFIREYFYQNSFEIVKKILINFSLDKKMNKSKSFFGNIITYIETFLNFIYYPFQLCHILPEFVIEFGYNCFKNSESLEKKIIRNKLYIKSFN